MVEWGINKLESVRHRLPSAGGLVIAPTIEMAEYFAKIIEVIDGEKPVIVHSLSKNIEAKIAGFKKSSQRWLVSVAMISEGVDIKRLRVLLYLPKATTELSFRQAIGRVVRSAGHDDDTRAYVVMPSFDIFENYARRVEEEMPETQRRAIAPTEKRCPICSEENELSATRCSYCEYEFAPQGQAKKNCGACGSENHTAAQSCIDCGEEFSSQIQSFNLTLKEALRTGAIVRGMDLSEDEVQQGEGIADQVFEDIYASGDENLIKVLKLLPEESFGRMSHIFSKIGKT